MEEMQVIDVQLMQLVPYAKLEQAESLPISPFTNDPYNLGPAALFNCLIESQRWRQKKRGDIDE